MDEDSNEMVTDEPSWKFLSLLPCSTELERSNPEQADLEYKKAISKNAGSYKLWHAYLLFKCRLVEEGQPSLELYQDVNKTFEKALVFMHKMPRIWIEYCSILDRQQLITKTRQTFDKALQTLPITQHSRIWPLYLDFIKKSYVPVETAVRIYKRYMQLHPEDAENFIDYLYVKNRFDEASKLLCDIINRPHFQSKRNKTKYQLWEELCDMICDYADQIHSVNAEAVLRDGIKRYPDQQGRLWNSLARYYIHLGTFANARNIYDEAINHVTTKKDFVEVWEAFTNFEEKYLEHLIEEDEDPSNDKLIEIEIRQTALEELITHNGLLLSRVALRQNPHNIREWQKRVQLCDQLEENSDDAKERTYTEAIDTIDPKQALGNYDDLWIEFALFYMEFDNVDKTSEIFEKAIKANFVKTDELAKVWCAYIEFKLKYDHSKALMLAKKGTSSIKNLKLWLLYADLEENYGNMSSTRAVYDRIIELRISTPQVILNYASYLEENQYYEDAFRVYERGVSLFRWPTSANIWFTYLKKFITRYKCKKLDRTRDILEQCLKDCPAEFAFEIYLLYAKIEEENGLLSRAKNIYHRAATKVDQKNKPHVFKIFLRSMMKLDNMDGIRQIYEKAIGTLDNKNARNFCLEYTSLEEDLNEIDRARTIYSFSSQMCDPRVDKEFWKLWADFEQKFGTLETIDEMLRIKRSIEVFYPRSEFLADV